MCYRPVDETKELKLNAGDESPSRRHRSESSVYMSPDCSPLLKHSDQGFTAEVTTLHAVLEEGPQDTSLIKMN